MKQIIAAIAVSLIAVPSFAGTTLYEPEDFDVAWVAVQDRAKNGCWTNIGEARTYAKDQLELAGFNVIDQPATVDQQLAEQISRNGVVLALTVKAERFNDGLCVGYIDVLFNAPMINPNRPNLTSISPLGYSPSPFLGWNTENFNNFVLDRIRGSISYWVSRGVR